MLRSSLLFGTVTFSCYIITFIVSVNSSLCLTCWTDAFLSLGPYLYLHTADQWIPYIRPDTCTCEFFSFLTCNSSRWTPSCIPVLIILAWFWQKLASLQSVSLEHAFLSGFDKISCSKKQQVVQAGFEPMQDHHP